MLCEDEVKKRMKCLLWVVNKWFEALLLVTPKPTDPTFTVSTSQWRFFSNLKGNLSMLGHPSTIHHGIHPR
jgi:phosphatidate phosphatase APP1